MTFSFTHLRMTFGFFVTEQYCNRNGKPVAAEPHAICKCIMYSFSVSGCIGYLEAFSITTASQMAQALEFVPLD